MHAEIAEKAPTSENLKNLITEKHGTIYGSPFARALDFEISFPGYGSLWVLTHEWKLF